RRGRQRQGRRDARPRQDQGQTAGLTTLLRSVADPLPPPGRGFHTMRLMRFAASAFGLAGLLIVLVALSGCGPRPDEDEDDESRPRPKVPPKPIPQGKAAFSGRVVARGPVEQVVRDANAAFKKGLDAKAGDPEVNTHCIALAPQDQKEQQE